MTTSIGNEGIGLVHEEHALLADSAEDLAAQVLRLLGDARLAESVGASGERFVRDRFGERVMRDALVAVFS